MSVHSMVVGGTMSGKTTLLRTMVRHARKAGRAVFVCDPNMEPGWHANFRTPNPDQLLAKLMASSGCLAICEEGGSYLTNTAPAMAYRWLVMRSRHLGHKVVISATKGALIPPVYRQNCGTIHLFNCTPAEAELWADEFNDPGLLAAVKLPRFQYLKKVRFSPISRHVTVPLK
jgi:hypothetical protein